MRNRVENIQRDGKPVAGAERGNTRAITPGCVLRTSVLAVKEDSAGHRQNGSIRQQCRSA